MTTTTRAIDERKADEFFASLKDAFKLIEKYHDETDQEIRDDLVKLGNYIMLREQGVEPVWAKISACRRVHIGASNKEFQRAERAKMEGMNPVRRDNILAAAKKHGIDTSGKTYVGALGGPNCNDAWVSSLDDVKSSARRQGIGISGLAEYTPVDREPVKTPEIAPDVIDDLMRKHVEPGSVKSPKALRDLRQAVVEHHKRKPKQVTIRSVR